MSLVSKMLKQKDQSLNPYMYIPSFLWKLEYLATLGIHGWSAASSNRMCSKHRAARNSFPREAVSMGSQQAPCSFRAPGPLTGGQVGSGKNSLEGWQKKVIVCVHFLPQGHESCLLLPWARGPGYHSQIRQVSACPQLRGHLCTHSKL